MIPALLLRVVLAVVMALPPALRALPPALRLGLLLPLAVALH